jgi:hypothetical protein
MFDPHLTAAEWYLGGLDAESLPEFAREALEHGYNGRNLAELATLTKPTKRDVERFVDGALREVGVGAPLSEDEAALWILGSVKGNANSSNITALTFVGKLLAALPELEKPFLEEVKSSYGLPGNYCVAFAILRPAIMEQIATEEVTDFGLRFSSFIEEVCNSGDTEAINVLWIELFEWLVHSQTGELKFLWPILGPSTRAVIQEVARRRQEIQNLP